MIDETVTWGILLEFSLGPLLRGFLKIVNGYGYFFLIKLVIGTQGGEIRSIKELENEFHIEIPYCPPVAILPA